MTAMLEVAGLTKRFGGLNALSGVDLHVSEGEIVSVIGPNGAGKTTFFNAVSGMYPPDGGDVRFLGQNIAGLSPDQITKLGIARTFQNVRLFPNMTVLENVMVAQHCRTKRGVVAALFRTPAFLREEAEIEERAREILSFFGTRLVGYRFEQPAFSLSYANRRRLEIARAMATMPQLLLLDEPTAGMNPRETLELTELIGKLRDERGSPSCSSSMTCGWCATYPTGSSSSTTGSRSPKARTTTSRRTRGHRGLPGSARSGRGRIMSETRRRSSSSAVSTRTTARFTSSRT
jgi:branched-chain amino acid transport system ATP-binding protein